LGQRIGFHNLGRGIAPAGVGDAQIGAEFIRAIDEAADGIQFRSFGVVPQVIDVSI
jgi:hypothetical protein